MIGGPTYEPVRGRLERWAAVSALAAACLTAAPSVRLDLDAVDPFAAVFLAVFAFAPGVVVVVVLATAVAVHTARALESERVVERPRRRLLRPVALIAVPGFVVDTLTGDDEVLPAFLLSVAIALVTASWWLGRHERRSGIVLLRRPGARLPFTGLVREGGASAGEIRAPTPQPRRWLGLDAREVRGCIALVAGAGVPATILEGRREAAGDVYHAPDANIGLGLLLLLLLPVTLAVGCLTIAEQRPRPWPPDRPARLAWLGILVALAAFFVPGI